MLVYVYHLSRASLFIQSSIYSWQKSFSVIFYLRNEIFSYEQQSLAVNDIFPALPKDTMPESSVLIKFSSMHEKNEDDDSCFTDDDGLQFGEIEY